MNRSDRRRTRAFQPLAEACENRQLLSAAPLFGHFPRARGPLFEVGYYHPVRPNTPVLPFGSAADVATYIDPTAGIFEGNRIALSTKTFVAPYVAMNAARGFIKIGQGSAIQDSAQILGNPQHQFGSPGVQIGDATVIGFGANVLGPATVGGYGAAAAPTYVGPNALIEGATIQPGAFVSALARVGPGVTVPSGIRVLPGANVTSDAEASNPALGKVVPVTATDIEFVQNTLAESAALATGYTELYEENPATGISPAVEDRIFPTLEPRPETFYQGNLAAVTGANLEPISKFETDKVAPAFIGPRGFPVQAILPSFPARIAGGAVFGFRAGQVGHRLGLRNSIRADLGQNIAVGSIAGTGRNVTIHAAEKGAVAIGENFLADSGAVVYGGLGTPTGLGDNVRLGAGAVVMSSTLGSNVTIGPRSYIANSTVAPGTTIPAGMILVNDTVLGGVQW